MSRHTFTNIDDLREFIEDFNFKIQGYKAKNLVEFATDNIDDIEAFDCTKYGIYELDIILTNSLNKKSIVRYNCYNDHKNTEPIKKIAGVQSLQADDEYYDDDVIDNINSKINEIDIKINDILAKVVEFTSKTDKIGGVESGGTNELINNILSSPAIGKIVEHLLTKDKTNSNAEQQQYMQGTDGLQ